MTNLVALYTPPKIFAPDTDNHYQRVLDFQKLNRMTGLNVEKNANTLTLIVRTISSTIINNK